MHCNQIRKIMISVIVIFFVFIPLFNICTNAGSVKGYSEGTIVEDSRSLEQINHELGDDLKANYWGTKYKLRVKYTGIVRTTIWDSRKNAITVGTNLKTDSNIVRNIKVERIQLVNWEKRLNTNRAVPQMEGLGTYSITFAGEYTTDWRSNYNLNGLPNVTGSYKGYALKFDYYLVPNSIIDSEKRHIYKIVKNIPQGSYNSSSSSNNNSSGSSTNNSSVFNQFANIANMASIIGEGLYNPLGEISEIAADISSKETAGIGTAISAKIDNKSIGTAASMKKENPYENMDVPRTDLTDDARRLYIRNLYRRVGKREPSNKEIEAHFVNQTHKIAHDIILSEESNKKNSIHALTYKSFIKSCYRYILGRDADGGGLDAYYNYLEQGNSKSSLINILSTSNEFYKKTNKTTTRVTLDSNVCKAVYDYLIDNGYCVIQTSNTTLLMYKDEFDSITSLDLNGKKLNSLSGISNFTNLKQLNISNNNIKNLDELKKLTNLEELIVSNNKNLSNIDGIKGLTKIKKLDMSNCYIKDKVAKISSLKELRELKLNNNQITDISSLKDLTKLDKLYLNKNYISDISKLNNLKNLKELYLDENQIEVIGDVGGLNINKISAKNGTTTLYSEDREFDIPNIMKKAKDTKDKFYTSKSFECKSCKIEDNKIIIDPGKKMGSIVIKGGALDGHIVYACDEGVMLTFNNKALADNIAINLITSERVDGEGKYYIYTNKKSVLGAKYMDLSSMGEEIEDLKGLSFFSNVECIELSNNTIRNYDTLAQMKSLRAVYINNNGLTNLDGLSKLKNIESLVASNNQITDVSGIAELTNLKRVILSNNKLGNNIAPLNNLTNLETLIIDNNEIEDISCLSNLQLSLLNISKNKISDISAINKKNLDEVKLNNNTIDINTNNNIVEIPNIIKSDISKHEGTSNLECVGCSIINNRIVLDEGVRVAQVKVKEGELSDTVVNIEDIRAISNPVVEVSKRLINNNTQMLVEIVANKKIEGVLGWDRIESSHGLRKIYDYNVHNQCITVRDLYGNETDVIINFDGVVNDRIPDLTVTYNQKMRTNKDVTIVISSSEKLYYVSGFRKYNNNPKTFVATYSENNDHTYTTVSVLTERMFDIQMQPVNVEVQIANIDKTAPVCDEIEYSTKDLTKGNVKATIWANEEIVPIDEIQYTKCKKTDENDKVKYGLTFYINENTSDVITVKDLAGNTTDVNIQVSNIDKIVDGLTVTKGKTTATNKSYKIKIQANEAISLKQIQENLASKIIVKTATNSATDAPIFRVAENDNNDENLDNYIELEINEPMVGVVDVVDSAGNEEPILIDTSEIDIDKPVVEETRTKNGDESITITLKCNEFVLEPENSNGWLLGEDNETLTKTYYSNQVEVVNISDLAGNILEYEIEVGNIQEFECQIAYRRLEDTDRMIVVITGNRELMELDGWKLSEDKLSIARIMNINETMDVIVCDINGNKCEYSLGAQFTDEFSEVDENSDQGNINQSNEGKIKDDKSQSIETMPQTGQFVAFALVASGLLIAITIVTLIKYVKTFDK